MISLSITVIHHFSICNTLYYPLFSKHEKETILRKIPPHSSTFTKMIFFIILKKVLTTETKK